MFAAIIFEFVAPLLHLLFRFCFDFYALATVPGLCVVCATCSAPPPNLAVKRVVALVRAAPCF
jgi:predicted metal-binding protein